MAEGEYHKSEARWQEARRGRWEEAQRGRERRICFWDGQGREMLQWSHTVELGWLQLLSSKITRSWIPFACLLSSIYHWLASISPHSSTWSLPSLFFSDYFSLQRWVSGFQNVPGWTRTSGVGQLLLLCFICHSILQSLSDWLSLFSPCTFFLLVFFWHHIQLCCFQVFPSFPLLSCCCRWLCTFCVGVCPSIFPFWWRTVLI